MVVRCTFGLFIDALVVYVHLLFFIIFIFRLNSYSCQMMTLSRLESLFMEEVCSPEKPHAGEVIHFR